jgi:hypothetical protein
MPGVAKLGFHCVLHAAITAFFLQLLQHFPCSYYSIFQAAITAFSMQLLQFFSSIYNTIQCLPKQNKNHSAMPAHSISNIIFLINLK